MLDGNEVGVMKETGEMNEIICGGRGEGGTPAGEPGFGVAV